ncbi:MAG: hypothetical protein IIW10_06285, partial [Spirochaetaceae bacterium]|nr:hypothetical protein [Spirochaetaceae bacterium]
MKKLSPVLIVFVIIGCKFLSFQPLSHKTNVSDNILFHEQYSIEFSEKIIRTDFEKYASLKNGSTQ